ncbi:MAG: hypothetical protein AAB654_13035 [Acidobacteriota bacterium]
MDTLLYIRTAISGWCFVLVFALSASFRRGEVWKAFGDFVGSANKENVFAVVAAGALAAPPLIGFLLERLVSLILFWCRSNMYTYPCIEDLRGVWSKLSGQTCESLPEAGAVFHALFYSYAREDLRAWGRRRRAHIYASFTGALSIGAALLLAVPLSSFDWRVAVIAGLFVPVLAYHGWRELRIHKRTLGAWISMLARKELGDAVDQPRTATATQ